MPFSGLTAILNDVWDAINHRLNVFIQNATLAVTQSGPWTVNQGTPSSDATASGSITAVGQTVVISTGGRATLNFEISGVFVATLVIEGQSANGTWDSGGFDYINLGNDAILNGSITGVIRAVTVCAGQQAMRIRCTAYTSGTVGVNLEASVAYRSLTDSYNVFPNDGGGGGNVLQVAAKQMLSTGGNGSASLWVAQKTPSVFKSAQATASGNTAVWTPSAGKKFRLMRFYIELTENAIRAAAGVLTITFQDATSDLGIAFDVWVPAAALTTTGNEWQSGWIDIGNGILSAAANNVLNINLSAALTGGNARVFVCGTEE